MKLATYNIQFGIGLDGRFDLERIAANVADADIIAFQEVTRNFARNGDCDMVAALEALLPGHFSVYGPAMDVDIGSRLVEGRAVNKRLQFGNMVFSRFPILGARNLLLPRSRTYDVLNLQRGAMEALIAAPSGPLRIYSVHLDHISGEERERQIVFLKQRVYGYALEGGAVTGAVEFGAAELPSPDDFVLMGDFNMEPESPEYCTMVGAADPSFGRPLRALHPVDGQARCGGFKPDAFSWTDMKDNSLQKHLDYCFVSASLAARIGQVWTDYDAEGSDHLPVWLDLN